MTSIALDNTKAAALHYVKEFGMCVIILKTDPAGNERKKPAIDWKLYEIMRPSPIQIECWFAKKPDHNIAAVMGYVAQMVAFDIDGPTAWAWTESRLPLMSEELRNAIASTYGTLTGSGSRNFVFRIEGDISDLSQLTLWTDGKPHSEIKLQANGHYVVVGPSIHPNGNVYRWNEKAPFTITRAQLDELIGILRPKNNNDTTSTNSSSGDDAVREEGSRRLTLDNMEALLKWIMPIYQDGTRDLFLFYLSGAMRKEGFPHADTEELVEEISKRSSYPDEDLEKNLLIVDRTYQQPLDDPRRVRGKAGLKDLLIDNYQAKDENEHQLRVEAFTQICQIINGEPVGAAVGDDEDEGEDDNDYDYKDRPGQWLRRQLAADKDLDVIETICNEVMRLERFRTFSDTKEIRWYQQGTYLLGGEDRITHLIEQLGGYDVSTHVENEVLRHIRRRTQISRDKFDTDAHLVNCRNCVIDLRTGQTYPHDPDKFLFTQQIPWEYRADEGIVFPEGIVDFLYNVMNPQDVRLVLEYLGFCLIRDVSLFQKALMIAGPPDQGKSKFTELVTALLGGKSNVSNKTMHQLSTDRFSRAALFGKLANIFADLADDRLKDLEMFKAIVGGDWIDAEKKGENSFTFKPYVKLIFSANLPPLPPLDLEDESAFYKRWFVVSFNLRKTNYFTGQKIEKDPEIVKKLVKEEEMSGLLYLAVKAAKRILANGGFSYRPDIETVREQYLRKAKPVKAWADACCAFSSEYQEGVDKHRIYANFVDYCNRKGLPAVYISILGRELHSPEYGVTDAKKGSRGNQTHVWKGIMLRKDLRAAGQLGFDEPEELED